MILDPTRFSGILDMKFGRRSGVNDVFLKTDISIWKLELPSSEFWKTTHREVCFEMKDHVVIFGHSKLEMPVR